jgi:hypothetical protein
LETIGNLTRSEEWKTSGQRDKDAAVKDMRAGREASDPEQGIGGPRVGQTETSLGNAVGCEGMVENGKAKQDRTD